MSMARCGVVRRLRNKDGEQVDLTIASHDAASPIEVVAGTYGPQKCRDFGAGGVVEVALTDAGSLCFLRSSLGHPPNI